MGHWYDKDGKPAHTYINKRGEVKDTTLREARKLGLAPSVSEITDIPKAPALENWKMEQFKSAIRDLYTPEIINLELLFIDAEVQAKEVVIKARDEGIRVHSMLEEFYLTGDLPLNDYDRKTITGVIDALRDEFGDQDWVAERTFRSPIGYGGTIDLHCDKYILDFKTKDLADLSKVKGWPNQGMQLSAYKHGINLHGARMFNVFVSTCNPGEVKIYEHEDDKLFSMFMNLFNYWKLAKNYNPNE